MRNVVDFVLSKAQILHTEPEYIPNDDMLERLPTNVPNAKDFLMFNSGGVEVEVAEFLYAITRMVKPSLIVETGTHLGISSSFFALACDQNQKGEVWTCEVIPELLEQAKDLWETLGVSTIINHHLQPSMDIDLGDRKIDLLLLDSEPQYRFDEFLKFWDYLIPGGLILIHDLHWDMAHHKRTYHNVYDWPYGDYRQKIGKFITEGLVQTFHFPTPRGLTVFQKIAPFFESARYRNESTS
jgi:predicted O-methyltransferase YrrM